LIQYLETDMISKCMITALLTATDYSDYFDGCVRWRVEYPHLSSMFTAHLCILSKFAALLSVPTALYSDMFRSKKSQLF